MDPPSNFGHNYYQPSYSQTSFGSQRSFHQSMFQHKRKIEPLPYNMGNNEEYWCETCDRSFQTNRLLEDHKKQHQKCNIDGCQFIAHPKIITKHIQMQHSTGIYKKIAKLNNPDEVKKWLEERKKRYPTKQNIEKRAAAVKEKIERGEKMGLKRHNTKKFENITSCKSDVPKKRFMQTDKDNHFIKCMWDKSKNSKKLSHSSQQLYIIPSPVETRKLKPFTGIHNLIMESNTDEDTEMNHYDFLIDDDEDVATEVNQNPTQHKEPKVCGILSTLICNYGSSDEEDNLNTNNFREKFIEKNDLIHQISGDTSKDMVNNGNEKHNNTESDEDSGPEEKKVVKMEIENVNKQEISTKNTVNAPRSKQKNTVLGKNYKNPNRTNFTKPKTKRPPSTLLRKLLWKEMRQERNMVLQCIRHIVKNKYFDESCK